MIKNIYKSYITTIIGMLFLLSDLAYLLLNDSPDSKAIISIGILGLVLLFMTDLQIRKLLNKYIK